MKTALAFLILITLAFQPGCRKDGGLVTISGTVRDEAGVPLVDVLIETTATSNFQTTTDQAGQYTLTGLPRQQFFTVRASKSGYIQATRTASFTAGKDQQETNFVLQSLLPFLVANQSTFMLDGDAQEVAVTINANVSWTVQHNLPWLQCTPAGGAAGHSGMLIQIAAHTGLVPRQGEVTIVGDGVPPVVLHFIQTNGQIVLIDHSGLQEAPSPADSVYLIFNRPITVEWIKSSNPFYLLDAEVAYLPDSTGFKFWCPYAGLGSEYGFDYSVRSADGTQLQGSIFVAYFGQKVDLPGLISTFVLTADNQTAWVITTEPNQLVEVDLPTRSVKQAIDIEHQLFQVCLNPDNHLLYAVPPDQNYIAVYDPADGSLVKKIQLLADTLDNQAYPSIYPINVAFGNNGYGVVTLRNEFAGFRRFKIIDSVNDDALGIYHPDPSFSGQPCFTSVTHDGRYILMTDGNNAPLIQVLDTETQFLSEQSLQAAGLLDQIHVSKTSPHLFVGGLYNQFIFDLAAQETVGHPSALNLQGQASADFSYHPDHPLEVYFINPLFQQFEVLRYDEAVTAYSCRVSQNFQNLTTTTDHQYFLLSLDHQLIFFKTIMVE